MTIRLLQMRKAPPVSPALYFFIKNHVTLCILIIYNKTYSRRKNICRGFNFAKKLILWLAGKNTLIEKSNMIIILLPTSELWTGNCHSFGMA